MAEAFAICYFWVLPLSGHCLLLQLGQDGPEELQ